MIFLILENCAAATISPYVADVYNNQRNYDYIITAVTSDNAANMVKAFSTTKEGSVQYLLSEKIISFFKVIDYFAQHKEKIDEFVENVLKDAEEKHREIELPTWTSVPDEVDIFGEPLSAIYEFTNIVEGDFAFEQDLYKAFRTAKDTLTAIITEKQNFFADVRLEKIIERFSTTAKLPVAELAYFLTPEGVNDWRRNYSKYFLPPKRGETKDMIKAAEASNIKGGMTKILLILASTIKQERPESYIKLIQNEFDSWLNNYELPLVEYDTFLFWKEKRNDVFIGELAERLFSMAKSEINKFNKHMAPDLFRALTIIKLCAHYRNAYP